jgi:hypothetical protein
MRILLLAMLMTSAASADLLGTLSIDTSGLIGDPNGPFSLDFQFVANTPNLNQVTLSNFQFGGGSLSVSPSSSTGDITLQAPFAVVLGSGAFLNDVQFGITPGASLSFDIDATEVDDPAGPDTFTFAILDSNGVEIPTTNSFFDVFAEIDLPSGGAPSDIVLAGTDSTRTSSSIAAPDFSATVPEPSGWALLGTIAAAMAGLRKLQRRGMTR